MGPMGFEGAAIFRPGAVVDISKIVKLMDLQPRGFFPMHGERREEGQLLICLALEHQVAVAHSVPPLASLERRRAGLCKKA